MNIIFKIFTISFLLLTSSLVHAKTDKITVGLDWFINPDHAPLIIANKGVILKNKALMLK
jgi:ABC-type nitrate/sulfonate/bicarbonate transport system substrate-binding protein